MIQVKADTDGKVQSINCASEPIEGYIAVESIPQAEQIEGKYPVMYLRGGQIQYEYVEPRTTDDTEAETEEPLPIDYNEEVNRLIRQRYTLSEELAILRQRDTKPQEFEAYNQYAEECKKQVKRRMA